MFGFERTWLKVLPAVVAFVWVVTRWSRYRPRWDWAQQMPALVLGSLSGAPYGWGFDQPVVMIAAVRAGVSLEKRPQRVIVAVFVLANRP
jgi:uncharacterized membrane-anchored protein